MPEKLPRLLYPAAFEALNYSQVYGPPVQRIEGGKGADAVIERLEDIASDDYRSLITGARNLRNYPYKFADLQRVIFTADYDVRLQPNGYPEALRYLGVDLFKELSKGDNLKTKKTSDGLIVLPPINPDTNDISFSAESEPVIYIASPYSIARAMSNIANRADRRDRFTGQDNPYGGYMIAYNPSFSKKTDLRSVISGGIVGRDNKITTEVFYPGPSTGTTRLRTSKSDDIVLFDNEREIELLDGNDIAIPSIAAFRPSIRFGVNIESTMKSRIVYPRPYSDYQKAIPGYKDTQLPLRNGDLDYSRNTISPSDKIEPLLNPYINKYGKSSTQDKDAYALRTDIVEAEQKQSAITIGGHRIYGGKGDDILYGFDPLLYAEMTADEISSSVRDAGRGLLIDLNLPLDRVDPLQLKFLDNKNTNINWNPILLSGGEGMDIFRLGDISRINLRNGRVNVTHPNGNTIYTILGDKDSLSEVDVNPRIEERWGDTMGADTFELTASYGYKEEVVKKGINIDYSTEGGGGNDWSEIAANTNNAARTIISTVPKLARVFPALDTALTFAELTVGLVKSFQNNRPAVANKFYREELKQKVIPPGDWTKAINIADWDPLDRFKIQVIPVEDPENEIIGNLEPWRNINFNIESKGNQSMYPIESGLKLSIQTAVDGTKTLANLTGLQAPDLAAQYGYKTYDFFTDREQIISPKQHITYFGVLANTEGAEDIKVAYNEGRYKLPVSTDSSVFLWNSRDLRDIQVGKDGVNKLDQYRSAASSIQIGVDTRQFGWYTDIKLDEDGKDIDLRKSTFNHWDRSQGKWVAVSLHKLANIDSNTLAAQNAAKARFSYWTVQDTYGNQLMNLAAADPDNVNDIDYYKSKDDGSVLDPLTGQWLLPADDGYEQAALSDENYAGAFALKTSEDGTISYVIEDGFKLSPFLKATLPNGETDYIFAYDEVNGRDPRHKRSSMVVFEDSGIIRFEDTIGGDYDYNDVIFDPSRDPQLAALIANRLVG